MPSTTPTRTAVPPPKPRAGERVQNYWRQVTEGADLGQLWKQFSADARQSYALYSREVDWEALQSKSRFRRFFSATWAVFHSMLMKLSPARRVLLLAAMVLLIYPLPTMLLTNQVAVEAGLLKMFVLGSVLLFILLALELADRVTMKRDLEIAREIQHWLVPDNPPTVANADIAFATRPANTVSGDYYDVLPWPRSGQITAPENERWLIVVADVAGKSIPAALLMATFQASLHTLIGASEGLSDLLAGLNGYACAHSQGGRRFTTAFFAAYEPASRRLCYINAGHNAPILKRANGNFEPLNSTSLPLGIMAPDPSTGGFGETERLLDPGDTLVIYTDGLVEAVNAQGTEYGDDRMLAVLRAPGRLRASDLLHTLFNDVERFVGETHQQDDITCLVFEAL